MMNKKNISTKVFNYEPELTSKLDNFAKDDKFTRSTFDEITLWKVSRYPNITKEIVDVFLKQQVQFVKENPEKLIKGYLEAKKAYEETQKAKADIENLSEDEKVAFNLAVKGIDLSKYVDLAKIYIKKILK